MADLFVFRPKPCTFVITSTKKEKRTELPTTGQPPFLLIVIMKPGYVHTTADSIITTPNAISLSITGPPTSFRISIRDTPTCFRRLLKTATKKDCFGVLHSTDFFPLTNAPKNGNISLLVEKRFLKRLHQLVLKARCVVWNKTEKKPCTPERGVAFFCISKKPRDCPPPPRSDVQVSFTDLFQTT